MLLFAIMDTTKPNLNASGFRSRRGSLTSIRILLPAVTLITTIPFLALLAIQARASLDLRSTARQIPVIVDASNDLFAAIQDVRLERGDINRALSGLEIPKDETGRAIVTLRGRSDQRIDAAISKLNTLESDDIRLASLEIRKARDAIAPARKDIDAALHQRKENRPQGSMQRWDADNDRLVLALDRLSSLLEEHLAHVDAFTAEMIEIKRIVWPIRSDSGDDRRLILLARTGGEPITESQKRELDVFAGRTLSLWRLVQDVGNRLSTPSELRVVIKTADEKYFGEYRALRDRIVEGLVAGHPVNVDEREWLKLSDESRDSIFQIARTAYSLASAHAEQQLSSAEREFEIALLLIAVFLAIGVATIVYVLRGVVGPIYRIADTMEVVAAGDLSYPIPYEPRGDEIGVLARSLRFFRDKVSENQRLGIEKATADEANRAKSQFLASISHELRTPLNAILGFSEVIKNAMFGPISERYQGYGCDIFQSGTHLLQIVNDVLDLSKLEAKQFKLRDEVVDVAEIIRSSVRLLAPQIQRGGIRLEESIGAPLPRVLADEVRMRQIVLNLLSNAVKFTPEGGTVRISAWTENGGVAIAVKDTGIGIPEDQIARVLEPFHQVDSKISRKHHGTGLGLPLAKSLVELHGGSIKIESQINHGTTVTVTFPPGRALSSFVSPGIASA